MTNPTKDIKSLTVSDPELVSSLEPAFEKYNEEQFITVKLPGGSQQVGQIEREGGWGVAGS